MRHSFSSNGDGFVFRDITVSRQRRCARTHLRITSSRRRTRSGKILPIQGAGATQSLIAETRYNDGGKRRDARYYQIVAASSRTVEAISRQASCWSWRLAPAETTDLSDHLAPVKSGARKRILFLADRNVLIDSVRP